MLNELNIQKHSDFFKINTNLLNGNNRQFQFDYQIDITIEFKCVTPIPSQRSSGIVKTGQVKRKWITN